MNTIIAYQGVLGAYSHLASETLFPDAKFIPTNSFYESMQLVENESANYAVIPIENSSAGRVEEIYKLIPKMKLNIIAEHFQPINHTLLTLKGNSIENIKYVASHPQALAQCDNSIKKLNLQPIAKFDTAGSAKELMLNQNSEFAVVASALSAKIYDLDILDENFADFKGNVTRFIILSKEKLIAKFDKQKEYITSLVFNVKNIPAALYKALGGFATNGIDLIKIESYSNIGSIYSTQFHVDLYGHTDEKRLKFALGELNFFCEELKVVGVYERSGYRDEMSSLG